MAPSTPLLVAPAGSPGALRAALDHGADAVYLGLRHLSARAHATNFALEQLAGAVALAHEAGCEVLVTLNTLVRSDELGLAAQLLLACEDAGVDAVVLQDLGLLELARGTVPGLRLHGSTQLAIHDADGAATAARLGLSRVVLARELSLQEIQTIHRRQPGVELEVFAHGSLCYAYSGLCLASAMAEERRRGRSSRGRSAGGDTVEPSLAIANSRSFSGNRGRCTQPCRRTFHSDDADLGLPFSLRDLMTLDLIPQLAQAGVAALKLEGRLRSPAYVAAACHAYRGAIDLAAGLEPPQGWQRQDAERDLRSLFSRRASTGYLVGARAHSQGDLPHPPVRVQPVMQGHLGPRVGRILRVGAQELEALVEVSFSRGDRLLIADEGGRLRHLDLAWMKDAEGRDLERADPGQVALIPAPLRFEAGEGQELRLAHSRSAVARFGVKVPSLLPPGYAGPEVELAVTTSSGGLEITARAGGVEIRDSYTLGPEPVDALRAPSITAVMSAPGDSFTLGPVRCTLTQREPLLTPRKALVRVRRDILRRLELALELQRLGRRYPQAEAAGASSASGSSQPEPSIEETWSLRSDRPSLLAIGPQVGFGELELVLDPSQPERLERALASLSPLRLACVLPAVLRGGDRDAIAAQILRAREAGVRRWVLANLGHLPLVGELAQERRWGDDLLYACNPLALRAQRDRLGLAGITLPLELDRPSVQAMLSADGDAAVVLYADVAVFRAALPPALPGLAPDQTIADELGHPYHRARQGRSAVLVDGIPLSLSAQLEALRDAGGRRFRVDLCWRPYEPDQARALLESLRAGQPIPGARPGAWTRRWL